MIHQSNSSHSIFLGLAITFACTLPGGSASAQNDSILHPARENQVQQALVTPSATAPHRSTVPAFFLSGNTSKTEAQVQAGFRLTQHPFLGRLFATLNATAPLSKDEDEPTVLGDLRGLGTGTTLTLSLNGLRWPLGLSGDEELAWCELKKRQGRIKSDYDCDEFDLADFNADKALKDEYFRFERAQPILYEISGTLERLELSYLDANTFAPASEDRIGRSIGASVGRFVGSQLWSIGYRYEIGYDEASSAQICVPIGDAGALRCRTAPLGAPTRREGSVANLQARGFLSRNAAWNPRLTYRFTDDVWGVEVPLYFVPDESGLLGGITPGYNSKDETWTITLFVGKTFTTRL